MKLKKKLITIISSAASITAAVSLTNTLIFKNAQKHLTQQLLTHTYHWRLGDISYTRTGNGRPILLIHSLDNTSSSYEWNKIVSPLSKTHTVYTLDLLGCGFSQKPDFTYVNFVFVQLINDFITNVIGSRTDVITSGNASSIALTSCVYNKELFNKIILLNPESFSECSKMPSKSRRLHAFYYNIPVYGTLAYNITSCRRMIIKKLEKRRSNLTSIDTSTIQTQYQNAHIGGYHAKYLYSSLRGKYMGVSIESILRKIDNSIYILGGESVPNINTIIKQYQEINPAIESSIAPDCKYDIAQENPQAVLDMVSYI
ncbi:MAG: alpha/beta hydrolase [Clostridiales bacterium]|nr:alpha/beta hydrolase [Clostridiales bacterium]